MRNTIKNPINLLIVFLLGLILVIPAVVTAGKGHHRHDDHHYDNHHYDRHDHGYNRHNRHSHRHYRSHNQPRGYYYNQPRYNIGYNQYPQRGYNGYNNYYPSQPYGYPPNVSLGINAGNTSFMLRY